jgi:predicted nucleic acid-binding protein
MIIIDTTIWIDFFAGCPEPHVSYLEELLRNDEDICICGVILTEILQGIRDNNQFKKTAAYLKNLLFLPMNYDTFIQSAEIFRSLRKKGTTIRKPIDCMIAAVALDHNVPLFHNDRGFDYIEKYIGLKTVNIQNISSNFS